MPENNEGFRSHHQMGMNTTFVERSQQRGMSKVTLFSISCPTDKEKMEVTMMKRLREWKDLFSSRSTNFMFTKAGLNTARF